MTEKVLPKWKVKRIEHIIDLLRKYNVFNTALLKIIKYLWNIESWRQLGSLPGSIPLQPWMKITYRFDPNKKENLYRKPTKYFFNLSEIIWLYGIWLHVHGIHGVIL